jgi:hypothetical protein
VEPERSCDSGTKYIDKTKESCSSSRRIGAFCFRCEPMINDDLNTFSNRAYGLTGLRAYGLTGLRAYGLTGLRAYGLTGLEFGSR